MYTHVYHNIFNEIRKLQGYFHASKGGDYYDVERIFILIKVTAIK